MSRSKFDLTYYIGYFQNTLEFSVNKSNMYSTIISVCIIWTLLVSYIIFYFRDDFIKVFCKGRNQVNDRDRINKIK